MYTSCSEVIMTDTALLLKEVEGLPDEYVIRLFAVVEQYKREAFPTKVVETRPTKEVFDEAARINGYKDHADYLRANSPATLEEAEAEAERKFNAPGNKNFFDRYYGILAGDEAYGDGMEYQRKMRDEWPD
jgi:hypothetical protein